MDHNPYLNPCQPISPTPEPGQGRVEKPGDVVNLVWQTRSAPPDTYAVELANALEALFVEGASSLQEIVAGLNSSGLKTAAGATWDETSFQAEIKRLGT